MSNNLPIRLIASDVDGTLLNSRGEITAESVAAIHAAQEKGIIFAICSGRFPENVYVRMRPYGIVCPIIGVNGCHITDENLHTIHTASMSPQAAKAVMDTLFQAKADFFMFNHHSICTSDENLPHHSEITRPDDILSLGFRYYHGRQEMLSCVEMPVEKYYICEGRKGDPLWQKLERIPGITLTQSGDNNIEVIPAGVDKATGVIALAQHYGIPLSQVMTLGDHENDIPMLACAGYGVAMGNGTASAKQAARYTTRSNDENGLAFAIRKWALHPQGISSLDPVADVAWRI